MPPNRNALPTTVTPGSAGSPPGISTAPASRPGRPAVGAGVEDGEGAQPAAPGLRRRQRRPEAVTAEPGGRQVGDDGDDDRQPLDAAGQPQRDEERAPHGQQDAQQQQRDVTGDDENV